MLYDYSGVVHIHSNYSDGSADFKGIAKAAFQTDARFVMINDHDTLRGLYQEGEKYLNGVLMLVGLEITPKRNHFLCYDVESVPSNLLRPEEYIGKVYRQGGFGFLAHPDQKDNKLFPGKMHWDNWDVDMPYGVEIWNYFSQWMGGFENALGLFKSFFFPKACLQAPVPDTLRKWDSMGEKRRVPAIAGIDAHGGRQFGWVPTILSCYKYQFRTLRTNVVTKQPLRGNLHHDKKLILSAIRNGQSYLVNYCAGKVKYFSFYAEKQRNRWLMGEETAYSQGMKVNVELAKKAHIKIIKNGRVLAKCHDSSLSLPNPGPGVYRVEVYKGNLWTRPWIFSNHIYLR